MRIAIETFVYLEGKRGGTYYVDSLLKALSKIDRDNEYLVFNFFFRDYEKKRAGIFCPDAKNFRLFIKRRPDSLVTWAEWGLKLPIIESWLHSEGAKVLYTMRVPCTARVPTVMMSHDIMYVRHPEHMYPKMRWGWDHAGMPGLKTASRVVVHSDYHRRELVEVLGVDERKIRVVLAGARVEEFYPIEEADKLEEARERLKLPERFALTIGPFNRWWCRYDALFQAVRDLGGSHPEFGLVLAGDDSSAEARSLKDMAKSLGLEKRLYWLGPVSGADLLSLFSLAVCNVYPAWDTGSSLNVLDSMSAGLPVLTSRASLLPEMLGEAGVWADPASPAELKAGLQRLLEDESFRKACGQAGLRRARERTWDAAARQTLAVLREAAGD